MSKELLKDLLWGIVFIILQVILIRHLRIFDTQADIIWPYILWIAATRNRTHTIITAAILAIFQDALLDVWGLNMFTKVLVIFIIYNFVPKVNENRLLVVQVFTVILISSLIHNYIFVGMSSFIDVYASNVFFWKLTIGGSIYTSITGTFIYMFSSNTSVSTT